MTEKIADDSANPHKAKLIASAEEAKNKSEQERRRNLEVRAGFYEKLSALDAGSIAVAVGIALIGKSAAQSGSLQLYLSWLLWIAVFLWVSLICSIIHNSLFVKITGLEAEKAREWANYLTLVNGQAFGSAEGAEIVTKYIADTFHKRIEDGAMNMHRTEQSVYRATCLGNIAVATFLIAYTLVMVCLIHLWWITRF